MVPAADPAARHPTIYFLTPDHDRPSGGIRVIYRQVDILNAAGIRAFVVHQRRGFRCSWFRNATPVIDVASAGMGTRDLLVVSEVDGDLLGRLLPGTRHVIFNQNSHLTWRHGGAALPRHYSTNPDLVGALTVSEHNAEMLRYAFPRLAVHRVHLGIDASLFHADDRPKPRRITYMPRRGGDDAHQVLELLRGRGVLDGWEVLPLDGLSHEEVAAELRTSRIFLAFTYQEGFGLPAAEAMACGNHVIGYHGFGGREFFRPEFSAPVPLGDVLGFAEAVEAALGCERADPHWCRSRGEAAAGFILDQYSQAREAEEVAAIYSKLLARDGSDAAVPR